MVCIRRGDAVDVLDDECPHEGHPLSMGVFRDGVLTCQWHNWRFESQSGRCLVGEESVRRHPSEVLHGEVFVAIDAEPSERSERDRHQTDLARALEGASLDGAVRSALRLARASSPWAPFALALDHLVRRTVVPSREGLSRLRAAWALYHAAVLSLAEALAVACAAAIDGAAGAPRAREPIAVESDEHDVAAVLSALADDRAEDAVALAIGLRAGEDVERAGRAWLVPWAASRLWDHGLLLARVDDALALAQIADQSDEPDGPALARRTLAAAVKSAAFAVPDSDLPGWRSTRQALLDARSLAVGTLGLEDEDTLVRDLLRAEAQSIDATRAALARGCAPSAMTRAMARASVERLARYDVRWSRRKSVHRATALDVGASARVTNALARVAPTGRAALALALSTAGLLGKQRRTSLDAPDDAASPAPVDRDRGARDDGDARTTLRALVRVGCLSHGALRGEGAPLAWALFALASEGLVEAARCSAAARRAFVEDARDDLERVAEVAARRVAQDGSVKKRPGSLA